MYKRKRIHESLVEHRRNNNFMTSKTNNSLELVKDQRERSGSEEEK